MDTRFWGPSGWLFLHQITFAYDPSNIQKKNSIEKLFLMLPFVLPCKFCRASLSEYLKNDPLHPALESKDTLTQWLYRIHNQVNGKLRNQGQTVGPDPSFQSVKQFYEDNLASGCSKTVFPGWEFLFSVAENHPLSSQARNSTPMPDAPLRVSGMTMEQLNEFNLMQPTERFPLYKKFWLAIADSLPYTEWTTLWKKSAMQAKLFKHLCSRKDLVKTLWKIRCSMENVFELKNRTKFADLCYSLASHRSGCTKSVRAITCRKETKRKVSTRKKK